MNQVKTERDSPTLPQDCCFPVADESSSSNSPDDESIVLDDTATESITKCNITPSMPSIYPSSAIVSPNSNSSSRTGNFHSGIQELISTTTNSLLQKQSPIRESSFVSIPPPTSSNEYENKFRKFQSDSKETRLPYGPINGDISDAVSNILKDYDWSTIPLANSDRRKVHVKRPMNAFMVWAQEARKRLSGQHRQVHNAELSKSLGRIWRGMTDGQKKPFIERAEQLRSKHKLEYPDYKYQPRRRKENIKTASGIKSQNPASVRVQDLSAANAYASMKGMGIHSLSPQSSPSGVISTTSRSHDHHSSIHDQIFVGECVGDNFDGIDRAELNKYLIPDQTISYVHSAGLSPVVSTSSHLNSLSMTVVSPNVSSSCNVVIGSSGLPSNDSSLLSGNPTTSTTTLQRLGQSHSRIDHGNYYTSGGSPYYQTVESPIDTSTSGGSPDLIVTEVGSSTADSPSHPSGSPDVTEYVELQPPRFQKDDAISTLGTLKSPSVNHCLPPNLCYYHPYNYSYTNYSYPM